MDAVTIARALGASSSSAVSTCRCPCCGYKNGFSVIEKDGRTLVRCHIGCDQKEVLEALRRQGLWDGPPDPWAPANIANVANRANADRGDLARDLWNQTKPASGTPVATYLRARGIAMPPSSVLRYHPAALHTPSGARLPCMVAAVTVGSEAEVVAVHRTFLRHDGRAKAEVEPAKMTLGPIAGGAIRLAPAAQETGLAEGIETALSASILSGFPVWSCLTAGGLRQVVLPPLPLAAQVVIFADNDVNGCGQAAAYATADRLVGEGRSVKVIMPPTPDTDFNDMLMEWA